MLETFYTDLYLSPATSRLAGQLARLLKSEQLNRIGQRTALEVPFEKVRAFGLFGFRYASTLRRASTRSDMTAAYLAAGRRFCELILNERPVEADGFYTFNSAALELLAYARSEGKLGVLEQTIAPRAFEQSVLVLESELWPGWSREEEPDPHLPEYEERERKEWNLAHRIVCGSSFVADALVAMGVPREKCKVVYYGVDLPGGEVVGEDPAPRLRILFLGTVGLRKGIGYLTKAAERLGTKHFVFRIAGRSDLTLHGEQNVRRVCEWIGAVPRRSIRAQLAWADVLVLPSLCEGSATVCYEALAAGLPVITTPNAGSPVRDSVDGFIVPVRDVDAITQRLEELHRDRTLLTELSMAARRNSRELTTEAYKRRLVPVLQDAIEASR